MFEVASKWNGSVGARTTAALISKSPWRAFVTFAKMAHLLLGFSDGVRGGT